MIDESGFKISLFDFGIHECDRNVFYGCCSFDDFKSRKYKSLKEAKANMIIFFEELIIRSKYAIELLDPDKEIRKKDEDCYF